MPQFGGAPPKGRNNLMDDFDAEDEDQKKQLTESEIRFNNLMLRDNYM